MRKLALLTMALIVFLGVFAFADGGVDFGGALSDRTGITLSDETSIGQSNGLSLWFTAQGQTLGFSARGGYTFVYNQEANPIVQHLPDIHELKFFGNIPVSILGLSRFSFNMGRFRFADHTRYVIDQNLDGVQLGFFYPKMSVQASFGTSLLPNKGSNPLVISKIDAADLTDTAEFMGSPRAAGLVEVVFADVFQQELALSLGFQEDLRHLFTSRSDSLIEAGQETVKPAGGGLVDTQYMGLGVRGNIVGGLFYNTFFTLSTGRTLSYLVETGSVSGSYAYTPILSGLGGVGLNLYMPHVMSSAAELKFLLSTGDSSDIRESFYEGSNGENPALFVPITTKPLSFVFAPSLGNLMVVELSYSLKPLSWLEGVTIGKHLQTAIKFASFLRYADGPVSVSVPNTESADAYLGSEAGLAVSFRPFSDLGISLTGGLFFPNEAAGGPYDAPGASGAVTKVEISASFSF
jgi:YD repeat-containing protein